MLTWALVAMAVSLTAAFFGFPRASQATATRTKVLLAIAIVAFLVFFALVFFAGKAVP